MSKDGCWFQWPFVIFTPKPQIRFPILTTARILCSRWQQDPNMYHHRKLKWQWKIHHLKIYFLLNMGIFQCHVTFQGCIFHWNGWQQSSIPTSYFQGICLAELWASEHIHRNDQQKIIGIERVTPPPQKKKCHTCPQTCRQIKGILRDDA